MCFRGCLKVKEGEWGLWTCKEPGTVPNSLYILSPPQFSQWFLWDGLFISCLYKWGNRYLGRHSVWPNITAVVIQHWNPGLETLHYAATLEYSFWPQRTFSLSSLSKKNPPLRFKYCLLDNNIPVQLIIFWNVMVKIINNNNNSNISLA